MVGAQAGEAMATLQTAIRAGVAYQKLRETVISHMTYAEGIGALPGTCPHCRCDRAMR
jgi:pyruvate/2-oxoglutarate dehydrogenase complex dihydrolipoamide dehydrogenase (E3) component